MKLLYRFFWALVDGDPNAKKLLLKINNHNEILKYAVNNRLEEQNQRFKKRMAKIKN